MTKLYIANYQTVASFDCSLDDNPLTDMDFEMFCAPTFVVAGTDLEKVVAAAKLEAENEVLEHVEGDYVEAPVLTWNGLELYLVNGEDAPNLELSRELMATVVTREVDSID